MARDHKHACAYNEEFQFRREASQAVIHLLFKNSVVMVSKECYYTPSFKKIQDRITACLKHYTLLLLQAKYTPRNLFCLDFPQLQLSYLLKDNFISGE